MRATMVALLFLLAGCTAPSTGSEPGETGHSIPTDDGPETFDASIPLVINPDLELLAIGGTSRNCVFFWDTDGISTTIVDGGARLAWDPLPNAMQMRLRTIGTQEVHEAGPGPSPLELPLTDVRNGFEWGLGFWVDYSLTDGTLPVAQQAMLHLEFTYSGDLPEPSVGTCSGGGA